jgi:hypothetical protein
MVNATLKQALSDAELRFDTDKYYNNSEPLQKGGPSLCGIYSLEEAHRISREGLDIALYTHESVFGGKTEIPVRELLTEHGYLQNDPPLPLRLPASTAYISHFTDKSLRPREQEMAEILHSKKSDLDVPNIETVLDRVRRYQSTIGENEIAEQKSLRQKYGHLFEIVSSDIFMQKSVGVKRIGLIDFEDNPYFAGDEDVEESIAETKVLVKKFNKILPRTCRVSEVEMVGNNAEMTIYIGATTASKIMNREDQNSFGYKIRNVAQVRPEIVNFSDELVGVDPQYSCTTKLIVSVSRESFKDVFFSFSFRKYSMAFTS